MPNTSGDSQRRWELARRRWLDALAAAGRRLHGELGADAVQRMYEAQTLWDEWMASSIAGYVSAEPRKGAGLNGAASTGDERMVVLAGTGHVRGRVGIPDRFTRRSNLPSFALVPETVKRVSRSVANPPTASEADWVLYSRPASAFNRKRGETLGLVSRRRFARGALEV